MPTDLALTIAEAYRWQKRLGNQVQAAPHCRLVVNRAYPDVWEANHADAVTAASASEMAALFEAMDAGLSHSAWRVVHTDGATPDACLARLALEDFEERPATIQMALRGAVRREGPAESFRPVVSDADWGALRSLVEEDFAEGGRTPDLDLSPAFAAAMVASYRAKAGGCQYNLVMRNDEPVAYGAYAVAPNGVGMIEDLYTRPAARRQGVASGLIAAFADRLLERGCRTIFLGALASERPKRLYARLGFEPVGLARTWVKAAPAAG